MSANDSTCTILLVEDDQHDAFFLKRSLQIIRPELPLQIVTDGEQALAYLNGHLKYSDRSAHPLPSLILLDLKLPYFTGFQILEQMRVSSTLSAIPVFVLTSSPEERDRSRAFELGAKGYFVKPLTPKMLGGILAPFPFA